MNIEFILLFVDYFKTLKKRDFLVDFFVPGMLGFICYLLNWGNVQISSIYTILNNSLISLLGVLIGFSIAVLTLLISSSSKSIDELKVKKTNVQISKVKISLFRVLVINYSYSIVQSAFLTIFVLFLTSAFSDISNCYRLNFLVGFEIFMITHILFLNIRNITNLYFVLNE